MNTIGVSFVQLPGSCKPVLKGGNRFLGQVKSFRIGRRRKKEVQPKNAIIVHSALLICRVA